MIKKFHKVKQIKLVILVTLTLDFCDLLCDVKDGLGVEAV